MEELRELVGHLIAMPLDRSRPLWEVWMIEGLEDGHVASLSKVHHSAIDGASGEELVVAILDLTPEIEDKPEPEEPWNPSTVPTETELFGFAMASLARSRSEPSRRPAERSRPRCRSARTTGASPT